MSHLVIACDLLQQLSQNFVNQGNIPIVWKVQMRRGNLKIETKETLQLPTRSLLT